MKALILLILLSVAAAANLCFGDESQVGPAVATGIIASSAVAHVLAKGDVIEYRGNSTDDIFKLYAQKRAVREKILNAFDKRKVVFVEEQIVDSKTNKEITSFRRLENRIQVFDAATIMPERKLRRFIISTHFKNNVRIFAPAFMLGSGGYLVKRLSSALSVENTKIEFTKIKGAQ